MSFRRPKSHDVQCCESRRKVFNGAVGQGSGGGGGGGRVAFSSKQLRAVSEELFKENARAHPIPLRRQPFWRGSSGDRHALRRGHVQISLLSRSPNSTVFSNTFPAELRSSRPHLVQALLRTPASFGGPKRRVSSRPFGSVEASAPAAVVSCASSIQRTRIMLFSEYTQLAVR